MWWLFGLVAAALLLFFIVVMSDIRCRFKYVREGENDEVDVSVTALFGLFRLRYRVPTVQLKPMMRGLALKISKRKKAGVEAREKHISKEEAKVFIEQGIRLIHHMDNYKDWFAGTLRAIEISGFRWETTFGLGGAPETGMTTGVMWSLKSGILAVISRLVCMKEPPLLEINPVFREAMFRTELRLRAKVRVYRLLMSGAMLVVRVLRIHGGWQVWGRFLLKRASKEG